MDDLLLRRGLGIATDVVLVGASAGGIGALAQADDWSANIKRAVNAGGLPEPRLVMLFWNHCAPLLHSLGCS